MNVRSLKYPELTIWAHSFCRSTLSTYLATAGIYPGHVDIIMCGSPDPEHRVRAGYTSEEYAAANFIAVHPTTEQALALLQERSDRVHMFCAYHGNLLFESLIQRAIECGIDYFIASEAPQNMERSLTRRIAKEIYIRTVLRAKVKKFIKNSRFMLCYSGNACSRLKQIGWPLSKIEEFGYYPPPLTDLRPNQEYRGHSGKSTSDILTFLLTGTHCRHKSPMTLVDAASILVRWGYGHRFECIVTGEGHQTHQMMDKSHKLGLPIKYLGFISLDELISQYAASDVFVATGVNEPWGIRVNDAMQVGCPSIVSTGMGAMALVQKDRTGWTYRSGSSQELAELMRNLIDNTYLVRTAHNHLLSSWDSSPTDAANRLVGVISNRFSNQ